jgi:uncharacterized protein with NAD-binding domain and iron-sulfur cluster
MSARAAGSGAKRRVAVLGGGVGGITAAAELTATPELRERFDVTVYQLGWRIGGKGASGRNPRAGNRIEEHGLHIWFGFYDNAFRLMRDAYAELGRPAEAPLARFEDAFKPCNRVVLYDRQEGGWHPFVFEAPPNFLRAGDPGELPTFWEMASTATRWALERWRELGGERSLDGAGTAPAATPPWFERLARDIAADVLDWELSGADHLLELAHRLAAGRASGTLAAPAHVRHLPLLAELLSGFRDWIWTHIVASRVYRDPDLRLFFTMFDVIASTVAGICEDGVLEHGFDAVNDEEWSVWLARHGAKEVTIGRTPAERSPMLRSVYDVAFGYVGGDIAKANVAAGTATNDLLRLLFSYRGALMYKMQAGMGDVVFTPLYEVLRRRGVRFEFFHAVRKLGLAPDAPRVDQIEIVPQVEIAGDEYEPLIDVEGLACWPSEPRWEQLANGDELRERGVNFELDANPLGRASKDLRWGVDFDDVVLGISVGALGPICGELCERDERFRRGIETAVTVSTQAFQLWVDRPSKDLGWEHGPDSVAGCYVEPLDTYCDMDHLLPRESWPEQDGVRGIAYFCGVLDECGGETQEQADDRVKAAALEFCESDLPGLWPKGGSAFDVVADPHGRSGRERFDSQYWRANIAGSELYVLTPAGTVQHRLPSDDSGFENLVLAGDWTKNGVDGGCVEAAAVSGIQAARKLTGIDRRIAGESPRWLAPPSAGQPPYVEYGGRATAPGPFVCLGGRLRGFVLTADDAKVAALVDRMLNVPAGPRVHYRALGSRVLLLVGGFDHVSSTVPPFDSWGAVREVMATFWIPVVAGRKVRDAFVAERVGLTTPYVLVDNPMSYAGGRETYGYAKTMAQFEPADGLGDHTSIRIFGGNFGHDEGAGWRPFLEVTAGPGPDEPLGELREPAEIVAHLAGDVVADEADAPIVGGVRLARSVVDDMLAARVRQVFLKQFRESADGTRGCYQSVVEAPINVKRTVLRPSQRDWQITIHHLDSHPIGAELGVFTQRPAIAFESELDMVLQVGTEVGGYGAGPRILAPTSDGAPWIEAAIADAFGLIEGTARFLYRGIPRLTRLRPF